MRYALSSFPTYILFKGAPVFNQETTPLPARWCRVTALPPTDDCVKAPLHARHCR